LIVKVIRAIFKRASAQCSDVVLGLLCPLFAHRAQSCGHSGLLSRRPPQKRPAEALRFDSAKALYVEIFSKQRRADFYAQKPLLEHVWGAGKPSIGIDSAQACFGKQVSETGKGRWQGIEQHQQKGLRDRIGPCVVP